MVWAWLVSGKLVTLSFLLISYFLRPILCVTAIVVAGIGFFTDAYDLFCISLVTKSLGRIYYHRDGSPKPGDYPLSATIMSEYANKKTRGTFIATVFAMQGFGILVGGMVAIVVSVLFNAGYPSPAFQHNAVASTVPEADHAWHVILILGVLPALLTYYWRHPNKTDSGSPPGIGVRNSLIVLGIVLISLECCLHCWYQNLKGNHWRKCQRKMKLQHDDVFNLYLGGIQILVF
ncbi:hypothetical protein MTR67_011173 [Solanum verrucosum]|uniref:PT1 n=1 Tax=Solanum verrucosum TaxID=315347 RepID=A0AAF0Q7H2_SOLVR|nr:hypothetical protein MTR67_011173 [Solanum verrucosum]